MNDFVGGAPQFDDLTMLCVDFRGPEGGTSSVSEYHTTASLENLEGISAFAGEILDSLSCPPKARNQIRVAIDEIFSNISNYAYDGADGPVTVSIEEKQDPRSVILRFIDAGKPFDPLSAPEPDLSLPIEDRPVGGLGIFLVRKTMDDVTYEYRDGKNILSIEKKF